MQAAQGKARCRRDGVLFGDADVEAAIGEHLRKAVQPRRGIMAAVMATTRSSALPSRRSSSENSSVHIWPAEPPMASPVVALILPTAWKRSSSWFSAALKPLPLRVMQYQDRTAELLCLS